MKNDTFKVLVRTTVRNQEKHEALVTVYDYRHLCQGCSAHIVHGPSIIPSFAHGLTPERALEKLALLDEAAPWDAELKELGHDLSGTEGTFER